MCAPLNHWSVVLWLARVALASGLAVLLLRLAIAAPRAASKVGPRGMRRDRALNDHDWLAGLDPWLRQVALLVARAPLGALRARLGMQLRQSGDFLGLSPDELIALGALLTLLSTMLGLAAGLALAMPMRGLCVGVVSAPGALIVAMRAQRDRRFLEVDRGLPAVIDLAALCMGAGLDFPASIELVVAAGAVRGGVLRHELWLMLQALEVGRTRCDALRAFAERVPTRSVRDFVSAATQAEERGTPLSEVLRIQAGTLRGRRSALAEEAAARAGVLMMLPLLLLLACVMLIAMGGMVLRGMETGL